MVVGFVAAGTTAQIFLRQLKNLCCHQRFMSVFGNGPILFGDCDLFLGLYADLTASPQHGMPQIDAVLQNAFYCGIVPDVRHSGCTDF